MENITNRYFLVKYIPNIYTKKDRVNALKNIYDILHKEAYEGQWVETHIDSVSKSDAIVFGKISGNINCLEYNSEPDTYRNITTVSNYDILELKKISNLLDSYYTSKLDILEYHWILNELYQKYNIDMFKYLYNTHISIVIWDGNKQKLIAAVTTPSNEYNHLYYGYNKMAGTITYSNSKEILNKLCNNVTEVENNTIMINNKIKKLGGNI